MGTREFIMIGAGSLFALLFIIYIISSYRRRNRRREEKRMLDKAYCNGDIAKMEYDIAFYEGDEIESKAKDGSAQQMTIDDIQDASKSSEDENVAEDAILTRVDDEGVEEITGTYNPDKEN